MQVFGAPYAMRIWLDPNKLEHLPAVARPTSSTAVRAQNAQVTVGQLGGTPAVEGQQLNATISAQARLQTPEQFRDIVVRSNPDGSALRLGDVARVELGAENYERHHAASTASRPSAWRSRSRPAPTRSRPRTRVRDRARANCGRSSRPASRPSIPFDTTPFVRAAIIEVVKTLLEAIGLVFLVMYLFLQNFRATLIPTIAVPVVLLGTFGVLAALGFSINMLTMFAMVLAIGLLVDDAIVVVENVERLMREEGLSPLEATRKSMDQITGALVGIGLVLAAVFVPMAFLGGLRRRHLPPVLGDDRLGDGALGAGRDRADAGALRHDAQAASAGASTTRPRGFFALVQPRRSTAAAHGYRGRRCAQCSRRTGRFLLVFLGARGRAWCCCSCACRARSCPTRTRAR